MKMRVHITGINENMMKQYYWHGEENEFFLSKRLSYGSYNLVRKLSFLYGSISYIAGKF